MKRLILFLIVVVLTQESHAQFGKKLKSFGKILEDVIDEVADDDGSEESTVVGERSEYFNNLQSKQLRKDTLYYNFTLAQAEKVSFFNSRNDNQNVLLMAVKNYEDETVEKPPLYTYERAFDQNRVGTNALFVNKKLALYSFITALDYYLDSQFMIESFLNGSAANDIGLLIPNATLDTLVLEDKYAITKTFLNLSIYYHATGQFNYAEQISRAMIPYIKENLGQGSLALISNYNNLAMISRDLGNYTEAEEYLSLATNTAREAKKLGSLDQAVLFNNQAMLHQELGRYALAIKVIDESISIASEEIGDKSTDFSKLRINKALILKTQGSYVEAEQLLLELKQIRERKFGKRHQDYADIESILASVYMSQGRWSEVEELLTHALDVYDAKFSKAHPAYTSTLRSLGQYHLYNKNYAQALSVNREVQSLVLENFGDKHPDYLRSLEDLALVYWGSGDFTSAIESFEKANALKLDFIGQFFPSLSENEKSKLWAKLRPGIVTFYAFATEQYEAYPQLLDQFYNLQLATKGILLSSTSKVRSQILASDDAQLKSTYLKWVALKEELANYYTLSKQALAEQQIDIAKIEGEANNLERVLGKMSSSFAEAGQSNATTIATVAEALNEKEVAVEIVRIQTGAENTPQSIRYVALALGKNGKVSFVKFENGAEMEDKLASVYRKSIQYKLVDSKSYVSYWEPLAKIIGENVTVYLSMDGVYNQINPNTLMAPSGNYISDELLLIPMSSTRDIVNLKRKASVSSEMLMFGFPNYGASGEIAPLPGTKIELEEIGKLARSKGLQVTQYYQNDANEQLFKSKINNPEVLHIATHGFFLSDISGNDQVVFGVEVEKAKENPLLRSGLLLADAEKTMNNLDLNQASAANNGILTAYEAMTLNLNKTKMVVLSACETGLGESKSGEGVYGLQRAFQIAGAETIVMSLWKVDDAATQKLMTNFYTEWLTTGDKIKAFKSAQQKLRTEFEEPYYWGAFVMMN